MPSDTQLVNTWSQIFHRTTSRVQKSCTTIQRKISFMDKRSMSIPIDHLSIKEILSHMILTLELTIAQAIIRKRS